MRNTKAETKNTREEAISHSPVKLVDEVILRAYSEKASDIHMEPAEQDCQVRLRIDGDLVHCGRYKKEIHEESIARLKVLASLRTDVRMSPQDGRFKVNISGTSLNIRLSVIPTFNGEKSVLRLLPQTLHTHTLESLGFSVRDIGRISASLESPHGMILVVGPTGSGKTTTLYSILQKVSKQNISTVTLEDPIEYAVPGITQIPVQSTGNMTFATVLRSVVRQDPDVIMMGEIRDSATAELSTHISLTGHLMLSTLHTNDAVTAMLRLADMGVEPFLIASSVRAVISQRLVRKICLKCAKERETSASESEYIKKNFPETNLPVKVKHGIGCHECRNTGYKGRTVVSEVLIVDDKTRNHILQKATSTELEHSAVLNGMTPIKSDAIQKVINGITTLEEIASIIHK